MKFKSLLITSLFLLVVPGLRADPLECPNDCWLPNPYNCSTSKQSCGPDDPNYHWELACHSKDPQSGLLTDYLNLWIDCDGNFYDQHIHFGDGSGGDEGTISKIRHKY